ncbi:hypothetical protein [Streptomyces sp. NPDC051286]|uniref:hypothetical protein n=1 Tax=Streptomyces sp. NPDC051286 TaxID=3365647 RepID=UPI0037B6E5C0
MDGTGDGEFDARDLDPDTTLWVRSVDYLAGWRDAIQAVEDLGDALTAVGIDPTEIKLRAAVAADGSGLVRLELSAAVAHEVAMLARVTAARRHDAS